MHECVVGASRAARLAGIGGVVIHSGSPSRPDGWWPAHLWPWARPTHMQVLRSEPFTEAADVWSYGVILWEILTGQVPWDGLLAAQVSPAAPAGAAVG